VEQVFGWTDLSGELGLALLRMFVVIAITMIATIPFTLICDKLKNISYKLLKL